MAGASPLRQGLRGARHALFAFLTALRSFHLVAAVFFGLLLELYLLFGLLGDGVARPLGGRLAGAAALALGVGLTAREVVRSMRIGAVTGVEIETGGGTRLALAFGVLSAPFVAALLPTAPRGAAEGGLAATSLLVWLLGARSAPTYEQPVSLRGLGGATLAAWSAYRSGRG